MTRQLHFDVRMRGFAQRVTVEQALAWLDQQVDDRTAKRELVPLEQAANRVLAEDITAQVDVPQFARAMMDGLAVRAADTQGATSYNRLPLVEIGRSMPGRSFVGEVRQGQAVRIMTGAPMPASADAVLPAEKIEWGEDQHFAVDEIPLGKHVGTQGEDIQQGALVLPTGRRLRPQDVGVLSSIGEDEVEVIARPRVRIVITGNELLRAGSKPVGHQITDANGPMLAALIERDGGIVINPGIVPDERDAIGEALHDEADVVLISGGSSVGEEDHAPSILAEQGDLAIHGIAMRPSSPTGLGTLGERLVFLLPGNPVSCLCAYDFYASRAIRALGGLCPGMPYQKVVLPLARKLVSVVGRVDYARVKIIDGKAEPLAISGASMLSSTTRADGFVVIPGNSEGYGEGIEVTVSIYDSIF